MVSDFFKNRRSIAVVFVLAALLFGTSGGWYFSHRHQENEFRETASAHYHLVPDKENAWYRLFDDKGNPIAGAIDFYGPTVLERQEDGSHILMTRFEDTGAYVPLVLDEELQTLLVSVIGEDIRYGRSEDDYDIRTDAATGLSILTDRFETVDDGHILLYDDEDVKTFRALTDDYVKNYPTVCADPSVGSIYAELEIKGHAKRFCDGFFFYQVGGMQYIDAKNTDRYWSLRLTFDEYRALDDYLRHNVPDFDMTDFTAWKPLLSELEIEYDIAFFEDDPRYQAALERLNAYGHNFPPEGMSEERIRSQIINTMKDFDADGDMLNLYGVAGMDGSAEEKMAIIDVPAEVRQELFTFEKNGLMENCGMSKRFGIKSEILRRYQTSVEKKDRMRGTWTLQQYDRIYLEYMIAEIQKDDPTWEIGSPFNADVIAYITADEVEGHIISDGRTLELSADARISENAAAQRERMLEWILK